MKIINTTLHSVTLVNKEGVVYSVDPCGIVISARAVEQPVSTRAGIELVKTSFQQDAAGESALLELETSYPGSIIVGSIIAAQAFPGRVLAMVPAPGFERVSPEHKRMCDYKFTTF